MLPSPTAVRTVYTFSFCNLSHLLISPALKAFFFFTGDFSVCNKFITEYHFSDKIHPDFQEVLCTMVLHIHICVVFGLFFPTALLDHNLWSNLLFAVMSFNISVNPFFKYCKLFPPCLMNIVNLEKCHPCSDFRCSNVPLYLVVILPWACTISYFKIFLQISWLHCFDLILIFQIAA